jgi:YD repeat-containing protein
VTQLQYDAQGEFTSSSTPDGNGSELATTTYGYNGDGEQTSATSPDGNLSGANAGSYTTITAYNADGQKTSVTQAGGSGATVPPPDHQPLA